MLIRSLALLVVVLVFGGHAVALGHPGSGIVVDRLGQVYFTDTGQGIWRIDERGRVGPHEGPAFHFLAIDLDERFARTRSPGFHEPSTQIERVGTNPTLLVSSDFPLTTGRDGSLYYPGLGNGDVLRVYKLMPSGERRELAVIPQASNGGDLKWLNGLAVGPDDAVYFTENAAVRRIGRQGEVSTIAGDIVVPDCQPLPGAGPHLGPFLRGLDVALDGTVYVAANRCCALLKITPQGEVTPIWRTISPWSPTGVAVSGDDILILEYLHTAGDRRREWTPRVRKLSRDGTSQILATIERLDGDRSRAAPAGGANPLVGASAGDEIEVGGVRLCWCPPGRFLMGSPIDEPGRRTDEAQVETLISRGFWTGKYEVTQGQWRRVMGAMPGRLNAGEGDDYPVYWVNFLQAEEFCRRLTELAQAAGDLPTGWEFRLPTEAQWEYACRAGTTTAFAFGETLTREHANIGKPYRGIADGTPGASATKVGSYRANAWGIHDMHGNEFEWCRDWYHPRLPGGADPDLREIQGAPNRDGTYSRIRRGGAWMDDARYCRSAVRFPYEPERGSDHIGFRVVLVQSSRAVVFRERERGTLPPSARAPSSPR